MTTTPDPALDAPVGASLTGAHAHLARTRGRVAAYPVEVSTFLALPESPTAADWDDVADLVGPGGLADLFSAEVQPPSTWKQEFAMPGLQMVLSSPSATDRPGLGSLVELTAADVPEMVALAELTRPGPFVSRTHEMGTFLGVRRDGRLVAMAGERLHPPGHTEISAVCTHPDERGRGHAERVVRAVAAGIVDRGERPFLHVVETNTAAQALYRRLGFEVRRRVTFTGYRVPGPTPRGARPQRR